METTTDKEAWLADLTEQLDRFAAEEDAAKSRQPAPVGSSASSSQQSPKTSKPLQ